MAGKQRTDARQRIRNAAVSLFARRGFEAVGMREIAEKAGVQLSMIDYYYGGKLGLLKEIIKEFHERYYAALGMGEPEGGADPLPVEERVRTSVRNIIKLYRDDVELAIAAMKCSNVDVPELHELQARLAAARRRGLNEHFARLGLDAADPGQMSVVRGLLTTLITAHFEARFAWEQVFQSSQHVRLLEKQLLHEPEVEFDDEYYRRYAELLSDLYLYGVTGMAARARGVSQQNGAGAVLGDRRSGS
jgi:TetR/AcrR family transcriptional regulator